MPETKFTNRLVNETSFYLLQHATTPSTGTPGVKKLFKKLNKKISPSYYRAVIQPAIGGMIVNCTITKLGE